MTNWQAIKIIATQAFYYIIKPFAWIYNKIRAKWQEKAFADACKRADEQAMAAKQNRYVILYNGKFYVYNKGGMMALAKKLHRATHLRVEWPTLYMYKAEWKKLQNK